MASPAGATLAINTEFERQAAPEVHEPADDPVQMYLSEIRKVSLLSNGDEDNLRAMAEMILALKEYKDLGNKYAEEWLEFSLKRLQTDAAKELAKKL